MKIKITRRQIAACILAAALLALNFTMRYGIWKKTQGYNLDITRYEKLGLAYHLKGQEGIEYELAGLARHDPSAAAFVAKTAAKVKDAKDAGVFLKASLKENREEVYRLKVRRFWISAVIYLVLVCQIFFNIYCWFKDNKHQFQGIKKK